MLGSGVLARGAERGCRVNLYSGNQREERVKETGNQEGFRKLLS